MTFNSAVDSSLPKVSHPTFTDRFALTSFGFVLAVTFVILTLHALICRGKMELALRLQQTARWAFPASYTLAIIAQAVLAFW